MGKNAIVGHNAGSYPVSYNGRIPQREFAAAQYPVSTATYRGGAEQKIRKYLVDNNYVDCVIQLPSNLFFGTSIATCIMVMKKNKADKHPPCRWRRIIGSSPQAAIEKLQKNN